MTEGTIAALVWTSAAGETLDLHSIPGLWCDVVAGLDDLPKMRQASDIVPFRSGRLSAPPIADARPVVIEGQLIPFTGADYAPIVKRVKRALDPFVPARGTLRATLEDGTVLTIAGTPVSIVYGEPLRIMPSISIELDAEPYWRSALAWGAAWMMDMGLVMDDGLLMDAGTGPITLVPDASPYAETFQTLGTTATLDPVIEVDGPSSGVVTVANADGVGFSHPALTGGQTLVVDAGARTAVIGMTSVRSALTLLTPNRHGEFFRVRPDADTITVTGTPAAVRIVHTPTFL